MTLISLSLVSELLVLQMNLAHGSCFVYLGNYGDSKDSRKRETEREKKKKGRERD